MSLYLGNNFVKLNDKTNSFIMKLKENTIDKLYGWTRRVILGNDSSSAVLNVAFRYPKIATNGNVYVICSDTKNVFQYSTDPLTDNSWQLTSELESSDWEDIKYLNNKFIAVSSAGYVAYSEDGINWNTTKISLNNEAKVDYGNGKYVIVGTDGEIFYSDDGINWIKNINNLKSGLVWTDVCYGKDKFIATSHSTTFAYSYDGITWNEGILPLNGRWGGCAYAKNIGFIMIQRYYQFSTDIVLTSHDGITWTEEKLPGSSVTYKIISEGDYFFIINYQKNLIWFKKGTNTVWASCGAGPAADFEDCVYYNKKLYITINNDTNIRYLSMMDKKESVYTTEYPTTKNSIIYSDTEGTISTKYSKPIINTTFDNCINVYFAGTYDYEFFRDESLDQVK